MSHIKFATKAAGVPGGIHVILHKCAKTQENTKIRGKAQRKYGEFYLDQNVAALHSGVSCLFFFNLSVSDPFRI